ncbi:sigma 54-interacting transcriptional regulator [Bacillus sp. ISL-47]|uniref:sigma-54 interaction domain-containing protein n=1 Tax=Bacillus sp. ISL-47 TaxID=2819130 RepID=UPI001BEAFF9B|nr:sigma 54-interacting transcriptional regulator [Bacillus sp. ISL-47]MBT2686745.1 sigma 54-interacting transcriptional regulator [Bacillus sp. ISL-47]MBT2706907.1 sigma 54-interacting transcriptional regulator [Pseudomonas sp. ISL-84]
MIDHKNKAVPVLDHVQIKELEKWLPFQKHPIVIVDKDFRIMGVLDKERFWRKAAEGGNEAIKTCTNFRFLSIPSLSDTAEEDPQKYDYFVVQEDHHFFCYTANELTAWHYSQKINGLMNINQSLQEELDRALRKNRDLKQILNSSYDEIFVTDAEGNVLFVSDSCKHFTGLPPEAYTHKNIRELVHKGIIKDSVTLKTMKTLTVQTAEQKYPNGKTVLATAKPVYDDEGKLYRIVTNSRDISELAEMKRKLLESQSIQQEIQPVIQHTIGDKRFITQSANMISALRLAEKIAPLDSSVFIHGESGVGKGVLARMIHEHSPRKAKPFIQVNCGAIPESLIESELFGYEAGAFTGANKRGKAGMVEMADGGTLFLDEIGEMPLELQVKILHLVQDKTYKKVGGTAEKRVDIRIISATNKDLLQMIEEKTFRQDLYYRLHVVPLRIPPLRDRKQDILLLTDYFLDQFNRKYGQYVELDLNAKLLIQLQEWRGNVRELENFIEQIVVTAQKQMINVEDLPLAMNQHTHHEFNSRTHLMPLKQAVEETEKQILSYALTKYRSTRKIAKALGVNQTTIMRKLHKYQLAQIKTNES